MHSPHVATSRSRSRTRLDHASIALLRSVMADDWRPEKIVPELLATVHGDRRVLVLMRAKLSRATLERPTRITGRAILALDQALSATADQARPVVIPGQGVRHG